ncbi:MAG: 5-formyltetrahydrofolate cyclo-ligase [Desulfuromonadaceae bacterium]|nr:5-formyltetrahydrofolate cyclo-ligase [Desulfuromonadaceae bacterium]
MPKQHIRHCSLQVRAAQGHAVRHRLSVHAQKSLIALPFWENAETVALYAPIRGEVETDLLKQTALTMGKKVAFPRVNKAGMDFVAVAADELLLAGMFGVPEPAGNEMIAPEMLDLVVVPGVAFGRCGSRLGYGKGFYDRYLSRCSQRCLRVGLGFHFQLQDVLPREPHDMVLDWLVTDVEALCFNCPGNNSTFTR